MSDKEFDIPVKSRSLQMELNICMECGSRMARYLCDYVVGKTFDLYGKGKITESTCDKLLCGKCTTKLNTKDYCKEHFKILRKRNK